MEIEKECLINRVKSAVKSDWFDCQKALAEATQSVLEGISNFSLQVVIPETLKEVFIEIGLPANTLSFVTELCKSSGAHTKKNYKVSKALISIWLEKNCLAEVLLRSSTCPLSIAETSDFCRNLFSIADNFHLNRQEFPRIISSQIILAVSCLSEIVKEAEDSQVRTVLFTTVLDRLFLRYHTDQEHFYPYFDTEDQFDVDLNNSDPFLQFAINVSKECKRDYVRRRIFNKIFQGLGQNPAVKLFRMVFLAQASIGSEVCLNFSEDLLATSPTWKQVLLSSIPMKTRTENLPFFFSWADFIVSGSSGEVLLSACESVFKTWEQLATSRATDPKTLNSSTCALIALTKVLKIHADTFDKEFKSKFRSQTMNLILQGAQKCMESTDTLKQACGMSVIQTTSYLLAKFQADDIPTEEATEKSSSAKDQLKFESTHPFFLKCTTFYDSPSSDSPSFNTELELKPSTRSSRMDVDDELDSDDEAPPNRIDDDDDDVTTSGFEAYNMSGDTAIADSLMNMKSSNKIPVYFSEIYEVLTEGHSNKDEAAKEKLKQIAVLQIPVLLQKKVQLDAVVATTLGRVLGELECQSVIEIAAICGLYELTVLYPDLIFSALSDISLDGSRYSAGHRMVVMTRYCEVVQLLSGQKCFGCFCENTGKLMKILERIHAPFVNEYLPARQSDRKCLDCRKKDPSWKQKEPISSKSASEAEATDLEPSKALTWREVVDRRIAAKTRRFASTKSHAVQKVDLYSSQTVVIAWASLANKLTEHLRLLLNPGPVENLSMSLLTAQIFRCLGIIVLGTSGIYCPHLGNIAAQGAGLIEQYAYHGDSQVRRAVLSLLGVILSKSESHSFVLENFHGVLDRITPVFEKDPDPENRELFAQISKLFAASTVVQMSKLLADTI